MTPKEREELLERIGDHALLMLEEIVNNASLVVFGQKRIALVPRNHPKAGKITELRLTTPPKPEEPQDPKAGLLTEDELEKLG